MNLSQKQQGHIIMFVVILIFALNIPISKYIFQNGYLTPIGITMSRISFGAIIFWIVSVFMPKEKVEKKDMLILFVGGLTGLVLNQGLFALGLGRTSPVDASIITTSSPIFTLIIAAVILKEPITIKKIGGVLIGVTGAIFLVYSGRNENVGQEADMWGNLAIVAAAFCYGFYLVITRPLSTKYSSITIMKWMFTFSALLTLPFFHKDLTQAPIFYQTNAIPFLLISFTLFGATFLTYMMIPLAQRRIRPTTISMYNNLQPLIASFVAITMGMDRLTLDKIIAGILIFFGVYLVTQSKSKADMDKELTS